MHRIGHNGKSQVSYNSRKSWFAFNCGLNNLYRAIATTESSPEYFVAVSMDNVSKCLSESFILESNNSLKDILLCPRYRIANSSSPCPCREPYNAYDNNIVSSKGLILVISQPSFCKICKSYFRLCAILTMFGFVNIGHNFS